MLLTRSLRRLVAGITAVLLLACHSTAVVYARSLDRAAVTPAAVTAEGCCDMSQANGCAAASAVDSGGYCAPICAQPRHMVTLDAAVPAADVPVAASTAESGRFKFPEKPPALTSAPPAISSTPLIYHLQRLLN